MRESLEHIIKAVDAALGEMLQSGEKKKPIVLKLRNGTILQATLNHHREPVQNLRPPESLAVKLSLTDFHNTELAYHTWYFQVTSQIGDEAFDHLSKCILILGNSSTKVDFQKNGLGTALLYTTNTIIEHSIGSWKNIPNLPVIGSIIDSSGGWASNHAEPLGYKPGYNATEFYKRYR